VAGAVVLQHSKESNPVTSFNITQQGRSLTKSLSRISELSVPGNAGNLPRDLERLPESISPSQGASLYVEID